VETRGGLAEAPITSLQRGATRASRAFPPAEQRLRVDLVGTRGLEQDPGDDEGAQGGLGREGAGRQVALPLPRARPSQVRPEDAAAALAQAAQRQEVPGGADDLGQRRRGRGQRGEGDGLPARDTRW
jgi:hypothetical protein